MVASISIAGAAGVLFMVPIFTSPLYWLPEPKDSMSLLGPLLGAQAAMAALTLAVTVLVVQGVSNKPDADDRTYREYVRRSRVEWVLWSSLGAAAITATVLVGHRFTSGVPGVLAAAQGLPNLTLVAVAALLGNLVLPGLLFRHAIHLARPDEWRRLRLEVNRRDVHVAVQVFLNRYRRAAAAAEADDPDLANFFPDPGEDAGNEAIRTVLGDARRAMAVRSHGDFTRALDSIKELVEYAMDELERESVPWERPGSQPDWPPLHRLGEDLRSFREDVIRSGDMDYIYPILVLDHWLLINGIRNRCGEMFTVALDGYRANYEIVRRLGSDGLYDLLRDRLWNIADGTLYGVPPAEAFPYVIQMARQQERFLSDAMLASRPGDFVELHEGFVTLLRAIKLHWDVEHRPRVELADLYEQLARHHRVALMGLGGRAVLLSESGAIADPRPYLDVVSGIHDDLRMLAADIAHALGDEERRGFSTWLEWEGEGSRSFEVRSVQPEQYPLTFFVVRLLELATDGMEPLNLDGHAKQVLGWFERHAERLEPHVAADPDRDMEERRRLVTGTLTDAVRADEVAEDEAIISWPLSEQKVETFRREVRASAREADTISRLFARAGALRRVSGEGDNIPLPFGRPPRLMGRGFFADVPVDAPKHYETPHGGPLGRSHAQDVRQLLCETLDEAPTRRAPLSTPRAFLQAIDDALEELKPTGEVLVVLAGDWIDVLVDLDVHEHEGYEPWRRRGDADHKDGLGRHHGHPVIQGRIAGERRLYVVEPGAWGRFVRTRVEGNQDLLVDVEPISAEHAQELLEANPDHFADEPDRGSKLRKLQAHVVVTVAAHMEFRVNDPSRARRIVASR